MGLGASKPPAPPPPATVTLDKSTLAGLLHGVQSQSAILAQQLAPPPPPPVVVPSPGGGWSLTLVVVVVAALAGIVMAVIAALQDAGAIHILEPYSGTSPELIPAAGKSLPLSKDQPQGMTFSYVFWLQVNNFAYRMGSRKNIWSKGTPGKDECPGVWLAANTNAIEFVVDNFKVHQESFSIDNIPASKWLHFAIVLHDERVCDVYVQGQLRTSHTLAGIAKQNDGPVVVASDSGFDGQVRGLTYFAEALSADRIASLAEQTPPPAATTPTPEKLFSPAWYDLAREVSTIGAPPTGKPTPLPSS